MTKGSPDYTKRLVSLNGDCVAPSSTKGDLIALSGKAKNTAEKDLVTKLVEDVKGVKSVKNQMTVE